MTPNQPDITPFDSPHPRSSAADGEAASSGQPAVVLQSPVAGRPRLLPRWVIGLSMISGALLTLLGLSLVDRALPRPSSPYLERRDKPATAAAFTLMPGQPVAASRHGLAGTQQGPLTYTVPPVASEDPLETAERRLVEERRIQDQNAPVKRQLEDKKRAIDRQLEDRAMEEKRRLEDKALDDQRRADDLKAREERRLEDQRLEEQRKLEAVKEKPAT